MLKRNKSLFAGEDKVREINRKVIDTFIDQIAKNELTEEEKKQVVKYIKETLDKHDKKAKEDSKFWYRFGKLEGEIKGMAVTTVIMAVSIAIAKAMNK